MTNKSEFLTATEAAALIGRSPWTVHAWREENLGPPAHRHGRSLAFIRSEILAWMEEHKEQLDKRKLPR